MAKHLFFAFTAPVAGREDEFNDWYDGVHLDDVLQVDGMVSAQRFEVSPQFGTPDILPGYLAIYEVEIADDKPEALEELSRRAGTALMRISDALDINQAKTFLATPITDRRTPKASKA